MLRKEAGLTQRQLADALDVTVTTISAWETGRKQPRLDFARTKKMMQVLNCTIDQLVEEQAQIGQKSANP